MKKLFLFLAMASTTMFVSCGSDDNSNTSTPPIEEQPTAITLTASASTVQVGTAVTFTVKNNLVPVVDVTSSSTFTANNVAFNGPTFTPTEAGTFNIVAKNGTLTSTAFVLTVTAPPVEAKGKYTFSGVDYDVNNMFFRVHGSGTSITQLNFADEGAPLDVRTLWVAVMYNGEEADSATAGHYMEFMFTIPSIDNGDDTFTPQFPGEAPATFFNVYAEEDLTPFDLEAVTGGSITFDSFVFEQTGSSSANSSVLGDGTNTLISHNWDGDLTSTIVAVGATNLLGNRSASHKGAAATMVSLNTLNKKVAKSAKVKSFKSIKG
jgi:hypothetical protein